MLIQSVYFQFQNSRNGLFAFVAFINYGFWSDLIHLIAFKKISFQLIKNLHSDQMGSFRSTPDNEKHTKVVNSEKLSYAESHMCGTRFCYFQDGEIIWKTQVSLWLHFLIIKTHFLPFLMDTEVQSIDKFRSRSRTVRRKAFCQIVGGKFQL